MLIINKQELERFQSKYRVWQGIPTIERTKNDKMFCSFYSGGTREWFGNFCVLLTSDDCGETWSDVVAAIYESESVRIADPILWIDPLGRLWWIYNRMPDNAVHAYICDNPDEELKFNTHVTIGFDHMLHKPIVLKTGEWMFPIAVWDESVFSISRSFHKDRKAFVYKTIDNGQTFKKLGGVMCEQRHFDEHAIIEKSDGSLQIYVRTMYGIGTGYSYDGGYSWTDGVDSELGGPDSRFFIRRLNSGRVLLINHYNFTKRDNLTAMLSEDDGKTWPYKLMLDERDAVSYPDAVEDENGYIYVVYDRDRGGFEENIKGALKCEREILMAVFTEEDIISGKITSQKGKLKYIVNKLGEFAGDAEALYKDYSSKEEYVKQLASLDDCDEILKYIFRDYGKCCVSLIPDKRMLLDELIEILKQNKDKCDICNRITTIQQVIDIFKGEEIKDIDNSNTYADMLIETVREYIRKELKNPELGLDTIASGINVSKYYMWHVFKKQTGVTMLNYIHYLRMTEAKTLLITTNLTVDEIANRIGFVDSKYFSKWFKRQERITPITYRKLNKH